MPRNNDRGTEAYRSSKRMRENHPEMQVMHSEDAINFLIDAQNMEDALKLLICELMGDGDINKGIEYWNVHYEEKLTRMLNELDRHKKDHKNSKGWFHLLNFTQRAIGNTSIVDFVRFARQDFDPVIKESTYTPDEKKKKNLIAEELEGFDKDVTKEFGNDKQDFTSFSNPEIKKERIKEFKEKMADDEMVSEVIDFTESSDHSDIVVEES